MTIIITIIITKIYLQIKGLCSSKNLQDPCFLNNINNSHSRESGFNLYNSNLCVLIYLRLATSRPLGECMERALFGREAADHERRSRERSTCLA